jgi:hypothetical protein
MCMIFKYEASTNTPFLVYRFFFVAGISPAPNGSRHSAAQCTALTDVLLRGYRGRKAMHLAKFRAAVPLSDPSVQVRLRARPLT